MSDANKSTVRRTCDALNRNALDELDGLIVSDFVRHCEATPKVDFRSLEDFKSYYRGVLETFTGFHMNLEMLIAEGDKVAFWRSFSGTQTGAMGQFPPSGKRITGDMAGVFRIEKAKVAELWITWDNLASLVQLGHFPPET